MFNESGECEHEQPKVYASAPMAGGVSVAQHDDMVIKHHNMIEWIKSTAAKRGIILTSDCIIGKTGVGAPSTKKRPGYGSAGMPGLLQKALACKDEKVTVQGKDGKYISRFKWKIFIEWEIRLMAEKLKTAPLKRKTRGDGYVGLLKIANGKDITEKAAKAITEYVKGIRCTIYVDDDTHYVRIPVQYDRKAINKKIRELL